MKNLNDILNLADQLLGENGCPWDKKQTLHSLKKYLLEEGHEVIEAIEKEDLLQIEEELGDLLYTIIFITKINNIIYSILHR